MIMNEWNAHFIKRYKYKYGMAKSAVEKTHILYLRIVIGYVR